MKPLSRPLRITHVVFGLGVGGLETGLVNLVTRLPPPAFEHTILCMKTLGQNAMKAALAGVRVYQVGSLTGRNRLIIPKLWRCFRALRPHVVHTRNFGSLDGVIAARLAGVSVVIHGEHGFDTADMQGNSQRRRKIRHHLAPFITRFVAVSDHIGRWLKEQSPRIAKKVTVIHNGVDCERFQPDSRASSRELPVLIGTIGRLAPVKDQALLMGAFEELATTHPEARLVMAGEGEEAGALGAQRAASPFHDRIQLLGGVADPRQLYGKLRVFALPSKNEGISNTILEAMASALPVVATAVGGNRELVLDGITGKLVPPGNPRALAEALGGYLDHPAQALEHGRAGRARVLKEFSLENMSTAYADLYERLLTPRP